MQNKTLGILTVITLIVVVIAVQMTRQENTIPEPEKLFPDLITQVEDISSIVVKTADAEFNLEKQADGWGLQQKSGYPADLDKVRQTLLGMADMTTLEAKTSNPELYERLGLRDVTVEGAKSALLTLKKGDAVIAEILVGNQQVAKTDPTRREFYVRKPDAEQTWLAISSLTLHRSLLDWVTQEIINLERNRVQQVEVTHADGETFVVFKHSEEATDYQLAEVPPRHRVSERYLLNQIGGTLSYLRMDDVKPASEMDFSTGAKAVFTTFNGLQVTMRLLASGEQYYANFSAIGLPADESAEAATETEEPSATATDTAEESAAEEVPLDPVQEAAELSAQLENWAFSLPDYKVEHFYKKMADFIESADEDLKGETSSSISGALDALAEQPLPVIAPPEVPETTAPSELPLVTDTVDAAVPVEAQDAATETVPTLEPAPTTPPEAAQPDAAVETVELPLATDAMGETSTVEAQAVTMEVTTTSEVTAATPPEAPQPATKAIHDTAAPQSNEVDTVQPESTLQLPPSVEVGNVGTLN